MNAIEDDIQYYQRRAEEEVARAQCATDPKTVSLAYELAELLLKRVFDLKERQYRDKRSDGAPYSLRHDE